MNLMTASDAFLFGHGRLLPLQLLMYYAASSFPITNVAISVRKNLQHSMTVETVINGPRSLNLVV